VPSSAAAITRARCWWRGDWRRRQRSPSGGRSTATTAPGNTAYAGQGDHSLSVADVDGDGKDDIIFGAMCVGSDGKGLYSKPASATATALHVSDMDPDRLGLEVCSTSTMKTKQNVGACRSATRGRARCCGASRVRTWAAAWRWTSTRVTRATRAGRSGPAPQRQGCGNCKGEKVSDRKPRSCNFGVWWDGDLLREQLDRTTISKWDWTAERDVVLMTAAGCASNNGTKATPALCADIFGDWREEVDLAIRGQQGAGAFTRPPRRPITACTR